IKDVVNFHTQSPAESEWNLDEIYEVMATIFPIQPEAKIKIEDMEDEAGDSQEDNMARRKIVGYLIKQATVAYNDLEKRINKLAEAVINANPKQDISPMQQVEQGILLRTIDMLWVEHLETMQYMRTGIGLRGYGQRDPLVEYKKEGIRMFKELLSAINKQITYSIFKIGLVAPSGASQRQPKQSLQLFGASKESSAKSPYEADQGLADRKEDKIIDDKTHFDGAKVGRNDPCPCGSGKKYKRCHGE
ncbi:MAG TPA: SEC-C metal-binding domain-containing protein, partial [Patescibacteria group bacterium]|nr:SEC-C metal-binding domain-containing protein [Patescibacteria group bacterium]